jgi:cytochrome c-type biogenesis protein CcmH/NrfF
MREQRLSVLPLRLPKLKPKLVAVALVAFASILIAQEEFTYMTPAVTRVGERLGCRCGGCKFTVGNCNMPRCGYANPKRKRIAEMQATGMSDNAIVDRFVQEEGSVTMSAPPSGSLGGLITWLMPGVMLLVGFFIYMRYVRGNRQAPVPMSAEDHALLERYRGHFGDDE